MAQVNIKSTVLFTGGVFLLLFFHFVPMGITNGGIRNNRKETKITAITENNPVPKIDPLFSSNIHVNIIPKKISIRELRKDAHIALKLALTVVTHRQQMKQNQPALIFVNVPPDHTEKEVEIKNLK